MLFKSKMKKSLILLFHFTISFHLRYFYLFNKIYELYSKLEKAITEDQHNSVYAEIAFTT